MTSIRDAILETKEEPYNEIRDLRRLLLQEQARVSLLREAIRLYERDVVPPAQVMWARMGGMSPNPKRDAEWEMVRPVILDAINEGKKEG